MEFLPSAPELWRGVVTSHDPVFLLTFYTWFTSVATFWCYGGLLLLLDCFHRPAVLYRYKIQASPSKEFDRGTLGKLLKNLVTNQLLVLLPTSYGIARLSVASSTFGFRVDEELPSWREAAVVVGVSILMNEIVFFYSHWIFHTKYLYQRFHKVHHEYTSPIALCAGYAHPVEMLFANVLSVIAGLLLTKSHVLIAWVYMAVGIMVSMTHHCGYRFPFCHHPWDEQPNFHDYHHEVFRGNYGLLGVLDRLHGTDVQWRGVRQGRLGRQKRAA